MTHTVIHGAQSVLITHSVYRSILTLLHCPLCIYSTAVVDRSAATETVLILFN